MGLKSSYDSLDGALNDIGNIVTGGMQKDVNTLTTNFVRWNKKNMFEDTGQSIIDVKNQTDFKRGQVVGMNPYFAFVYFGTKNMPAGGRTGKPEPFAYTWNERIEDIEKLEIVQIEKRL